MLALAKKTDYVAYDPSTRVRHFLNGITDPSLAQAKLSLEANRDQYSGDFDATVEYLMNQVTHQQVNQQLHIASVDSSAPSRLKTKNAQGNDLEMPLIEYSNEQWAQLSSAQKTSIRKRRLALQDRDRRPGSRRGGGRERKRPREARAPGRGRGRGRGNEPRSKSDEYRALVASVATLSNSVNVMAASMHPGAAGHNDDNAKPAADNKMWSNSRNSALIKNPKKEKE